MLSDPTIAVCQHYVGFIEQVYTNQEQVVNMCVKYEQVTII